MKADYALQEYLRSLKNETTRANYEIVLSDFVSNFTSLSAILPQHVQRYKNALADKSPQTVAARLAAIRSFFNYCWVEGWISGDPSEDVQNNHVKKYGNAKNVAFDDFKNIISKTDLTKLVGIRDYLLLRLIFTYGDVKKIVKLSWETKLTGPFANLIRAYRAKLAEQTNLNNLSNGYLFFNLEKCENQKFLSVSAVRKVITKYTARAGYPDKFLDFQAMKRLRARQIYKQTDSIEAVQKFCGHASQKVTKAFIKTLN